MGFPHHMPQIEQQIVGAIIKRGLEAGLVVSVFDGEEWPVKVSDNYDVIATEVAATDMTQLRFRRVEFTGDKIDRPVIGDVFLIHGNGEDVVHDHTDNDTMKELCRQ